MIRADQQGIILPYIVGVRRCILRFWGQRSCGRFRWGGIAIDGQRIQPLSIRHVFFIGLGQLPGYIAHQTIPGDPPRVVDVRTPCKAIEKRRGQQTVFRFHGLPTRPIRGEKVHLLPEVLKVGPRRLERHAQIVQRPVRAAGIEDDKLFGRRDLREQRS